jgi:hypothetical protein
MPTKRLPSRKVLARLLTLNAIRHTLTQVGEFTTHPTAFALAALLRRAAQGREDAAEVAAALQFVLQIERVPYRIV